MPSRRALLQSAAAASAHPVVRPGDDRRARPASDDRRARPASDDRRARPASDDSTRSADAVTLAVRVHRVPSISTRVQHRVVRAVDHGVEQVARHANAAIDRPVDYEVEAGATTTRGRIATNTRRGVFDSTADWLDDADRRTPDAVHLLLVDAPFQQSIGYGGNRTHLLNGGPVSYANVGATDRWDGPTVSDNIAVHEVVHALVTPFEARDVIDRGCEHDLGAVIPAGDGRGAIVTPMATAYAETTAAGETAWPGSGCTNRFSRDVGYDPDWWGHTYALSSATLDATARYVARL